VRTPARPEQVVHQSVSEVAHLAATSESTVVRTCQRLGFQGFQALKIALARDTIPALKQLQGDVQASDSPADVLSKVLTAAGAPLAQDEAYRLLTLGIRAQAPPDVHVQHVAARLLATDDVCFAVSHTGQTRETVATIRAARDAGATTIAVTSFSHSPLTEVAEVVLVAGSRETAFRIEAMASRIAHVTVLDALFVSIALADRRRASSALDTTASVLSEHRF
jgi:RpiR family transcriptional regulator, carbohydrate utilization regulator